MGHWLLLWCFFFVHVIVSVDISLSIQQYIRALSLEQKIGQMTMLDISVLMDPMTNEVNETALLYYSNYGIGSYLNSPFAKGPKAGQVGWTPKQWRRIINMIQNASIDANGIPIIYGIDSVHGANYVQGAVYFPQPINMGNTFNRNLTYLIGEITGRDTLAAGISWTFAPILDLAIRSRWSRNYETFGEDPYTVSRLGNAFIRGVQNNEGMTACFKHFIGYSATSSGYDRDNVRMDIFELLNYYFPPYRAAMAAGAKTGMEAYSSFNGVPTIINPMLLSTLLRRNLHFNGPLVTDYSEVYNLHYFHGVAQTKEEAVLLMLNSSTVDINMVPLDIDFITIAVDLVTRGLVPMERINMSVERILTLKQSLGLFNIPVPGKELVPQVGNVRDAKIALDTARESIVLLQNQRNTLPISLGPMSSVFVTGIGLNSLSFLCSGWTVHWQGSNDNFGFAHGQTILESIETISGRRCDDGISGLYCSPDDMDVLDGETMDNVYYNASLATYTVVIAGEMPYAEKPGDIDELDLNATQLNFIQNIARNTNTRIILVLVEGRPRLLGNLPSIVDSVIFAGFPCEYGGIALAEILFGFHNPSGKLAFTYPKTSGSENLPYYRYRTSLNASSLPILPQWSFGTGLSYTTFEYSAIELSRPTISLADTLDVSFTVRNIGFIRGKETIFLFVSQLYRLAHIPEVKLLKRFEKIELRPGEVVEISFVLGYDDFSYIYPTPSSTIRREVEIGDYYITVGAESTCNLYAVPPEQTSTCKKVTIIP